MSGIFTINVASKWDDVALAANTNWFSSDLGSSVRPQKRGFQEFYNAPIKHSIELMLATPSLVKLIATKAGANQKIMYLNSGLTLSSNSLYIFDFILHSDITYNIQHETASQNPMCLVTESFNCDV